MKATYSEAFKEQALAKVFRRGNRTVQAVADELNMSVFTLKGWMTKASPNDHNQAQRKEKRPQDWRLEERLMALQESHGLTGEALNAWCREKGLFAHHLAQWKADFCSPGGAAESRADAQALRTLKEENQRLQRELTRKEKALAEAAALLVLQKKYRALLGEEVE
jgi:transposase-like protein